MLTPSLYLAQLLILMGLILGAWSYRNIWCPPPQLEGKYGNQYAFLVWIGFGFAIVMLVCGGASIVRISL